MSHHRLYSACNLAAILFGMACVGLQPQGFDSDGVPDVVDDWPARYKPTQEDSDRDGIGNVSRPSLEHHTVSSALCDLTLMEARTGLFLMHLKPQGQHESS